MKKFFILFIAIALIAAFSMPVSAAPEASFYGSARVRAHMNDTGTESSWYDQRFRVGTRLTVAEGIYGELRADYNDGKWGLNYGGDVTDPGSGGLITRPTRGSGNALDIDRAFLNFNKGMFTLRAGQQYLGLGVNQVLDANAPGLRLDFKVDPVQVTAMYVKVSENGSTNDDGDAGDEDFYGVNLNFSLGNFNTNLFGGMFNDDTSAGESLNAIGINGSADLGMVNLTAEIATFSGDNNAGTDYMGTQFYVDASANITDTFNVGAHLLYALGSDDGETQITNFSDWWSFDPLYAHGGGYWAGAFGWSESDDDTLNHFDPSNDSAGVQGIVINGTFKPMADLSLGASVGYLQPQEDSVTDMDDTTALTAWASYTIAQNTKLHLVYLNSQTSRDGAEDNEFERIAAALNLSF